MSESNETGLLAGSERLALFSGRTMTRARWSLATLALGLVAGAWCAGGPDRFGEPEGILGGVRGASRTMAKGVRYLMATLRDVATQDRTSVRDLGLAQQVETRLWQDKRLVADGIVVEVEGGGTVVLKGLVLDLDHKEKAVALVRDTRGVERIVDQLAVAPASRTIVTTPSAAVPTGVASGVKTLR